MSTSCNAMPSTPVNRVFGGPAPAGRFHRHFIPSPEELYSSVITYRLTGNMIANEHQLTASIQILDLF